MKLATTTEDFIFYTKDYVKQIQHVKEAGFRYIDLSLYAYQDNDPLFSNDWKKEVERIKNYMEENGLKFVQSHGFNANCLGDKEEYRFGLERSLRCIEICGALGIPNVVIHPGHRKDFNDKDLWFEENRKFFRELIPAMESTGVEVLCENSTKVNMSDRYFIVSGKETRELVEYVGHPLFAACWDTGHANDEGNQYDDIIALGDAMHAIHFNDNRGKQDEHLLPYMGNMNIDEVMTALCKIGYNYPFTFESSSVLRHSKYWLGGRREFGKDNRLLEPTLEMRKKVEELTYIMGKHILSAYDLFED